MGATAAPPRGALSRARRGGRRVAARAAGGSGATLDGARREQLARCALYFAAFFAVGGVRGPFLPQALLERGLQADAVGTTLASSNALRLALSPAMGVLSDALNAPRTVAAVLSAGATVCYLLAAFGVSHSALLTAVAVALAGTLYSASLPPAESVAVSAVKEEYGRVRLCGSLSYAAANIVGGILVAKCGVGCVFPAIGVLAALSGVAAFALPGNAAVPAPEREKGGAETARRAWRLARNPIFLAFLLAAGLTQASHACWYSFGTLHLASLDLAQHAGPMWALGTLSEVVIFALGPALTRRVSPPVLLALGGVAGAFRWAATSALAASSTVQPGQLVTMYCLQPLHALSFGVTHAGAMAFMEKASPKNLQATAQSYYSMLADGVLMGLATIVGGKVFQAAGGSQAFLCSSGVALCGIAAAALLGRLWDGKRLTVAAA